MVLKIYQDPSFEKPYEPTPSSTFKLVGNFLMYNLPKDPSEAGMKTAFLKASNPNGELELKLFAYILPPEDSPPPEPAPKEGDDGEPAPGKDDLKDDSKAAE